ncbi:MAG: hypothetical protein M0Q87_07920, partial [Ottowia sp.]|nr:hypothetical protein [Ottowia sp.]
RIAKARPIKTQSAGMARAMASICNAEWAGLGGQSGHEGFFLKRSGKCSSPLQADTDSLVLQVSTCRLYCHGLL